MNAEFKISLSPVTNETATGVVKDILDGTQAQLGFVPNMYRTMANSPGYLSTYSHGYKAFRSNSGFTAKEQETIFLAISRGNGCDYCTAAHSMIADKVSKHDAATLDALRNGTPIADARLQALAVFTTHVFDTRGRIGNAQASAFLEAGYSEKQIMEVVLAISVKILSNYSNHIFHTDLDEMFTAYAV